MLDLLKYGFEKINYNSLSKEYQKLFQKHKDNIYENVYGDEICKVLRPYIYYEHPAIIFDFIPQIIKVENNFIEQRRKFFISKNLKDRLTFCVDTWAIDIVMEDAYNELSDKDKKEVYIENRKRKEYNFEEYDKLYKPKNKKKVKLPKKYQNKKELIIYRGIGDKSNKELKGTLSWTLDLNVAKFFKNRFGSKKGWIWIGKCNPKDIDNFLRKVIIK